MSARVSISLSTARELLGLLGVCGDSARDSHEERELRSAIERCERTSEVKARLRKPKAAKKRAKREETSEIRIAVCLRADDKCEACGTGALFGQSLELDHFFGRAKARQSVANCWLLCHSCHRAKTDNQPSAIHWWQLAEKHFLKHGYIGEAASAWARLQMLQARGGP